MSQSNPLNKKSRQANRTLLIFGEGLCEEMFLKHLKGLYAHNTGVAVTIRKGKGGDAQSIVVDAHRTPGDFDRIVVVLDNDKAHPEMESARCEARRKGIELFENTPCLESLLLLILGAKPFGKDSPWCKAEFERKYISHKKRREPDEYYKSFPKGLLEKQRAVILELDRLIQIMEGK